MSAAEVAADLQGRFGESVVWVKENRGDTYIGVRREALPEIAQALKDELGFSYFAECLGVDYLGWKHARDFSHRFEVVYNLVRWEDGQRLFLKVGVDEGETMPSLMTIYAGAEYPELEIQDLYGIPFDGNSRPGRWMLPDDWVGYPLRKDVGLGGEDVHFHEGTEGPAVEDVAMPHAGESFDGKTGTDRISGR